MIMKVHIEKHKGYLVILDVGEECNKEKIVESLRITELRDKVLHLEP